MADEDERGWRSGCLGCSGLLLAFLAVVFLGIALEGRGFDPDRRCAAGEDGSCLSVGTGFVESTNGFFDRVTVRYDDGRRATTVTLSGSDEPPVGSRLRLEWWEDEIVALVDARNEHRYETNDWPDPWWEWALAFVVCIVTVGVALGVVFGIAALSGRLRRRRGAIKRLGHG